jgi:hypothetical protein
MVLHSDLQNDYGQVHLHPEVKEKAAFSTGEGLWQFTVMPFDPCNAPWTFGQLVKTVLTGLTYKTYLVYLDDVIMIGRTFQVHFINLRKAFQRFREARLKLNAEK